MFRLREIIGRRVGGDPESESDHFYVCKKCGQAVDRRDLGEVFHHEQEDHKALAEQLTVADPDD